VTEPHPRVLVVEDEPEIRRFVCVALERDGYEAYEADGVERGAIEAGTRRPDLVVLDLGLPDGDGVELIRRLRTWSDVPIVVLSARTDEPDKVDALDAGADDYLVKPFGAGGETVLEFGDVRLDRAHRSVERGGEAVHLTPIEYRLLAHLAAHPHSVLTHRQLLQAVWGPGHVEDSHYLRVYMATLRKKIERDPAKPAHLVTETGIGYRFVP